jgi:hypothetical protein
LASSTSHTHPEDEAGGRFQKVNAATVIGSEPTPKYPILPAGPWSGTDPVSTEPPLGYSVNQMMPLEPSASPSVEGTGPTVAAPVSSFSVDALVGPLSTQSEKSDA